jgi:hypothetical protein
MAATGGAVVIQIGKGIDIAYLHIRPQRRAPMNVSIKERA